jgi:hypothetical protein
MSTPVTVISVDDSKYLWWQSVIFAHSFRKVEQPGKLVRLVASGKRNALPWDSKADTFYTRSMQTHPLTHDFYPPYNKPWSLHEWLSTTPPSDDIIYVLDPDILYLKPVVEDVKEGSPVAEKMFFMDPSTTINKNVIKRHAKKNHSLIQPIGVPLVLHRNELQSFVSRWYTLTVEMRSDPKTHQEIPWIAEMWACAIAAAEAGVNFRLTNMQQFPTESFHRRPLIHYSYDIGTKDSSYHWSKRTYQPWSSIPPPPDDFPETGQVLWKNLNEIIPLVAQNYPVP